jgi:hypothetical protein
MCPHTLALDPIVAYSWRACSSSFTIKGQNNTYSLRLRTRNYALRKPLANVRAFSKSFLSDVFDFTDDGMDIPYNALLAARFLFLHI